MRSRHWTGAIGLPGNLLKGEPSSVSTCHATVKDTGANPPLYARRQDTEKGLDRPLSAGWILTVAMAVHPAPFRALNQGSLIF